MTAERLAHPSLRPDRAALVALVRSFMDVFVAALRSDPADGAAHALAAQIDIGMALADAVIEEAPPEEVAVEVESLLTRPSPPFRTVLGRDAKTVTLLRRGLPDRVFSAGMRFYSRYRGG